MKRYQIILNGYAVKDSNERKTILRWLQDYRRKYNSEDNCLYVHDSKTHEYYDTI